MAGLGSPSPLLSQKMESLTEKPMEFDLDESIEVFSRKTVATFWGEKNGAKTATAYGMAYKGDKIVVLSYDHQSGRAVELPFIKEAGLEITVLNMLRFEDKSTPAANLKSAGITQQYTLAMIKQVQEKLKPDWILIDCAEELHKICERVMRSHNGLTPYSGTTNPNVWKERNDIMDDIHHKAIDAVTKGVIYTVYSAENEIILAGNVLERTKVPKWIAGVLRESTFDCHVESTFDRVNEKTVFTALIKGSKDQMRYPDGLYTITGKRLRDVLPDVE